MKTVGVVFGLSWMCGIGDGCSLWDGDCRVPSWEGSREQGISTEGDLHVKSLLRLTLSLGALTEL